MAGKIFEFHFEDKRWRQIPGLSARLEKAAAETLAQLPEKFRFPCSAAVVLISDAKIRRLNRDFRGKDKPTDVLSFPQFEPRDLPRRGKAAGVVELGDIILAYQYIVVETKKERKILINHAIHLVIHGLLHLFGYDHQTGNDAGRMERLEGKIMRRLGLPDPYGILPAARAKSSKSKRVVKQRMIKRKL